jgi:lipoyl(octanoyl) transferase
VGGALACAWLGRVHFRPTWQLQEDLRAAVLDGSGRETLLLLEHHPVVTLGRAAHPEHLLCDERALGERGIEVVRTSRGGDVTYHGPGQLVAYPVVRLGGVRSHVEAMAGAVIEVVAGWGIAAAWRPDPAGVWVGDRKLCAFGVHVHRRVAIHGLALNVTTALEPFSLIVPCGLRGPGVGVTSMAELTGARPALVEVAGALAQALARHLGRQLEGGGLGAASLAVEARVAAGPGASAAVATSPRPS